uniref:Retrovirus-related Pol polyprotein from transposon TNT 1-94 n=1 Tax=Tanacetum cinerariifolium TaxID=118510 RepID=A0A6L2MHK2_TANCI|nr:retrovirus-related Pol polyprotein from transposon TNT 1-94 [Tanacetum cinerariifolium]
MSGTVPPIPPPPGTNPGNSASPNRVDTISNDSTNDTGGSHVKNVPDFDVEDFSSWKDKFLVYLNGLDPYLLEILENKHFDRRLANQDKRLKSIIISCLPNDAMKYLIKCTTAQSRWNDLILAHEGPFDTRDTKIDALRLKFNAFKAMEDSIMSGTVPPIPPPPGTNPGNSASPNRVDTISNDSTNDTGGSHVKNVPDFDVEDFSSWKDKFLVYLNGLDPYLLEILENKHFDRRLANQDKRLKSIIISCLPNDAMKYLIKCTTAQSRWNDLILAHEGPFDTRDTKIDALRLKFNAFKAMEGLIDQIYESETQRFTIQSSTSKALISNTCIQDSDSDDEESLSSKDEGVTTVKSFMAILEDETTVGKVNARPGQWVEITMKKRKNLLSKFNSLKQELSSCNSELVDLKDTKVHKISLQHEISRLNLENESLRDEKEEEKGRKQFPQRKLCLPRQTSLPQRLFLRSPLTLSLNVKIKNLCILFLSSHRPSQLTKHVVDKESLVKVTKKKAQTKSHSVPNPSPAKKANSSTEQLLLTLMEEYCGFNDHHSDECEYYPGCDICDSIAHETANCTKKTSSNNKKPRIAK